MSGYVELPGEVVAPVNLKIPKAKQLARHLTSGMNPFAHFVESRSGGAREWIVLDLNVATNQISVNEIAPVERVAVSFTEADLDWPETSALRTDFPWVPHLYPGSKGSRNLCLYEEPYSALKLRWTAQAFIERIREWLSKTAAGELHQGDQPLEQVFRASPVPLILPSFFVADALGQDSSTSRNPCRLG